MRATHEYAVEGRLVAEAEPFAGLEGKPQATVRMRDFRGGGEITAIVEDEAYGHRLAEAVNAAGMPRELLSQMSADRLRAKFPNIGERLLEFGFGRAPVPPGADASDLVEVCVTRTGRHAGESLSPGGEGWTVLRSILKGTHPLASDEDKLLWVRSKPVGRLVPRPAPVKSAGAMGVAVPVSEAAE